MNESFYIFVNIMKKLLRKLFKCNKSTEFINLEIPKGYKVDEIRPYLTSSNIFIYINLKKISL